MSRYIDADAVESTLQEMEMITAMSHIELGEEDDVGEISMPMFTVRNIMKRAPSIEIVRCKECKHYDGDDYGEPTRYCVWHGSPIMPDDFCSYGERKESEQIKHQWTDA